MGYRIRKINHFVETKGIEIVGLSEKNASFWRSFRYYRIRKLWQLIYFKDVIWFKVFFMEGTWRFPNFKVKFIKEKNQLNWCKTYNAASIKICKNSKSMLKKFVIKCYSSQVKKYGVDY